MRALKGRSVDPASGRLPGIRGGPKRCRHVHEPAGSGFANDSGEDAADEQDGPAVWRIGAAIYHESVVWR